MIIFPSLPFFDEFCVIAPLEREPDMAVAEGCCCMRSSSEQLLCCDDDDGDDDVVVSGNQIGP